MNVTDHLLVVAMEECAEVAKECAKALRFGLDDVDPNDPTSTNRMKIIAEYYDLQAIIEMLQERSELSYPRDSDRTARIAAKKAKVGKFLNYSRDHKRLE